MKSRKDKVCINTALSGDNLFYIESLYRHYLEDSRSVGPSWKDYFDGLSPVSYLDSDKVTPEWIYDRLKNMRIHKDQGAAKNQSVVNYINDVRRYGHYFSDCGYFIKPTCMVDLSVANYGLSDENCIDKPMVFIGKNVDTLSELQSALKDVYMRSVGYEYMYIDCESERLWLQERIERGTFFIPNDDIRRQAIQCLIRTEGFEQHLGRKFVGQKRFSLEGGEGFIPLLESIIACSAANGFTDIVVGMAHRGRLNVLSNVFGMSLTEVEEKFLGVVDDSSLSGDVKYHLGYSADRNINGQDVHLVLGFNPSHLEVISPVMMGSVRSRIDHANRMSTKNKAMAVLVHGDAALSGQGVVAESLNMSYTDANNVDGSIHVVINNQIGFTTDSKDARSSTYCTDVAKMIGAPVFHVNGDDIDAIIRVVHIACDYKNRFKKDVFIDLVCFRRHGHNESDEPSATNPMMYGRIKTHPGVTTLYANSLVADKCITEDFLVSERNKVQNLLKKGGQLIDVKFNVRSDRKVDWHHNANDNWRMDVPTAISSAELQHCARGLMFLPKTFNLQKQVALMYKARKEMFAGKIPLNWGCAELLAYASLLREGYDIRLVGQDVCRGTFSHRHAMYVDQLTGERLVPLSKCTLQGSRFFLYNSVLSEYAELAFEYGYAESSPKSLVIWEAQFGDFANNAQVVIDQFLASAWQKWKRMCGLVLLLPHGYEGQGPEHSSARLERFLQLCAQENMQVCIPSMPEQFFHLMRRQILRPYRRPLVIMTPKSLLRHPEAVSELSAFEGGKFEVILPDAQGASPASCTRLLICSGKVYFGLCDYRKQHNLSHIHIIRLEQLYPFPYQELTGILVQYSHLDSVFWCQEEPQNQGAWYSLFHRLGSCLAADQGLLYVGRPKMAAPAAGYLSQFKMAQEKLLLQAMGLLGNEDED